MLEIINTRVAFSKKDVSHSGPIHVTWRRDASRRRVASLRHHLQILDRKDNV
jgi:hypothetical protein